MLVNQKGSKGQRGQRVKLRKKFSVLALSEKILQFCLSNIHTLELKPPPFKWSWKKFSL